MYVHCLNAWFLQRLEEAVKSQTGVTEGCEHHVGAGIQTQILWKSNQRTHWAIFLAPVLSFYFIMYILVHRYVGYLWYILYSKGYSMRKFGGHRSRPPSSPFAHLQQEGP